MLQELDRVVSEWIRESGINPIMLGWLISVVITCLWQEWRGK